MKPDTYVPDTGVVTSCYYVSLPTATPLLHASPPSLYYRLPRLLPSSSHFLLPSYAFIDWRSFDARVYAHIDELRLLLS